MALEIPPLHFISGLPRSGSTLLAAILRQNPAFATHVTSPLQAIFAAAYQAMGAHQEGSVFLDDARRAAVLKAIVAGYYGVTPAGLTVFDTNRAWTARMPALATLFPQARIIACVRNPAWIIDSFERLHAAAPLTLSRLVPPDATSNVYLRTEAIGNPQGVLGFSWSSLREAFFGAHASRLVLIEYELLAQAPKYALHFLYDQLKLPRYAHDFSNVRFEGAENFDANLGVAGLHAVRPRVEAGLRETILPPDIFQRHQADAFWRNPDFAGRGVPMALLR